MAEHSEATAHDIAPKFYVLIWAILMALTLTTVLVSFLELGPFNIVLALVIASIKGTLVALFFMHLRYSSKLTAVTVVASIFWLLILFSLTLTDYLSRGWETYFGH